LESALKNAEGDFLELAPKNADADGKVKASLIPWDILMEFLPPAYEEGLIKYEKESWRRGFKVSQMFESATRHLTTFYYQGENLDPEAVEKYGIEKHHLAGAIFSLLSILHTMKYRPELDDRRSPTNGYLLQEPKNDRKITDIKKQR